VGSTRSELLGPWLHIGDERLAGTPAIATREADGWSELTYRDLHRRSSAVATRLAATGVGPGDTVALRGPSGGDWTAAFFGILRRGAVAVLLDTKLTGEELADLVRRSGVVATVDLAGPFADPHDDEGGADVAVDLGHPAVLVWTSGTTGAPKGVTLSLANLAYVVEQASAVQGTDTSARWLSTLPPNHLLELCCGLLPGLAAGSTTFVCRTVVPGELMTLMADCTPNRMVVVPVILRLLKRHLETQPAGAPLPAFYCGGAPLDPEIARFFDRLGAGGYEGYGLTEAAPTVAMNAPGRSRTGSVGLPLPGTDIRIAGDGEILVRSPGVMLGYWDDDRSTREAVDADGWLHTGDLGRLDGDGYLYVTGRAKSLIVLDTGKKVQPEEVEIALARSDLFADSCVVGRRDPGQGGEQVCAVVVPSEAFAAARPDLTDLEEAAADEVRRCTGGLSAFKRPTVVRVHLGELPRTPKRSVRQAEVLRLLDRQEAHP
jgi:long-chain acyl-CoA synthetase